MPEILWLWQENTQRLCNILKIEKSDWHIFKNQNCVTLDVKRHCGMCRQHSLVVETRGHICPFKNCGCEKCKLVRQRRSIMSTQIRLRREQDKRFQRTTNVSEADVIPLNTVFETDKRDDINMCYFCQKCKNHGILMWKKDHKRNCEYANCRCEQCDLIDTRRALDRHIKKSKDMKSGNLPVLAK
ncbi:unnamed protein product [Strongylus vulgaris]|uniref:DM domain-containing protein n=1 Tax=Strongylus vulgaris TaxID=40348 RepID=A0A3P7I490_STRVU|nr:unnamed protein product [Strongylus vulgaris]